MNESSFHDLTSETRALLSRHNLLKAWVRAEITATAVQTIAVPEEEGAELWNRYLKEHNIKDDDALGKHLQQIGLSAEDLHWQLELPQRIRKYSQAFSAQSRGAFSNPQKARPRGVQLAQVNDGFLARSSICASPAAKPTSQTLLLNTARARKPNQRNHWTGSDATGPPALSEELRTSQQDNSSNPSTSSSGGWWHGWSVTKQPASTP